MENKLVNSEVLEVINRFLEKKLYSDDLFDEYNLLSIIVYGSALTGYASKNSDIDLLIVNISGDEVTRGVANFEGRKIEYFIKPIQKFFDESQKFIDSNCPSHLALLQNGYFIFDRGGVMQNFLKTEEEFYNKNRKKPNLNLDMKFVQIENRIASLKGIYERNGKEFNMVYYNILELIRTFHMVRTEEADIGFAKAYRVYTDSEYYKRYVSENASNPLPDEEFVELYKKCIDESESRKRMLNNIEALYEYEKQFVKIDPSNYEIKIK